VSYTVKSEISNRQPRSIADVNGTSSDFPLGNVVLAENDHLRIELIEEPAIEGPCFQSTRYKRGFCVDRIEAAFAYYHEVFGGVTNLAFGRLLITHVRDGQVVQEHVPTATMIADGCFKIIDVCASQANLSSCARRLGHDAAELLNGSYECITPSHLGNAGELKAMAFVSTAGAVAKLTGADVAVIYETLSENAAISLGDLAATIARPNGLSIACAAIVHGLASVRRMDAEPSKIVVSAAPQPNWSSDLRRWMLATSAKLAEPENEPAVQSVIAMAT
jgi:hypothetical protein